VLGAAMRVREGRALQPPASTLDPNRAPRAEYPKPCTADPTLRTVHRAPVTRTPTP